MLSSLLPDHQSCNKLEVTLTDVFPLLQFHFLSSFVVIELLLQNHSSHEKKLGTVFVIHQKCLIYISTPKLMLVFQIFDFWCKVIEWEFWVNFQTLWLGRKNKSRNIMTLCHHLFFWCWMRRTWWENLSQITFALGVVVAMLCLMLWEKL